MKISIITVTYNSAATLRDTMQSVLNQTFKDIDYILVDGNSSDGTVDIIREYESRFDGRLHYISEPDKGIYDAMNKGIKMASGDIIGILNSDDFFASDNILSIVAQSFNSDNSLDAVYADVTYVDKLDTSKIVRYYSSAKFNRNKIKFGLMPAHPSFYVKKYCYDNYGLYDLNYKISADYDMFVRLIWNQNIKTKYLPINFVLMRNGGASSSNMLIHKKIMIEHIASVKKNHVPSNFFLQSLRYFGKIIDLIKK